MSEIVPITAKKNVDSRQTPRAFMRSRRIPPIAGNVTKQNLKKCDNRQSQAPLPSLKRVGTREPSIKINLTRRIRSKVALIPKHTPASICSPAFYGFSTPPCRKSLSMVELSSMQHNLEAKNNFVSKSSLCFAAMDQLAIKSMSTSSSTIRTCNSIWNSPMNEDNREHLDEMRKKAACSVCHILMLNAWRHRREEVRELHETTQHLTQQIYHSQLQTVVLKRLLDTENNRVSQLGAEIHQMRSRLENTTNDKNKLAVEKEMLENKTKKLKDVSEEREITSENLKNELLSTKNQLKAVEVQIERDHEKLFKLREDKRILLEKVLTTEKLVTEHWEKAEQAEVVIKNLQEKIEIQIDTINKLQNDKNKLIRELEAAEAEKTRLENSLSDVQNTEKALNVQATNLTIQLSDREAALRKIESAYNTQLIELNDLRGQLLRQNEQIGWSSRMLQIAGSMVRAPRAILRTISFLSSYSIVLYRQG